jgi:hypothetical protein
MAKQKVHEQFGVTFPESYWRPAQVTIVPADRRVGVVFYGYASSAARHAGLPPIGQRSYFVHEDDYEARYGTATLDEPGQNPIRRAYELAMEMDDFFEGALDV